MWEPEYAVSLFRYLFVVVLLLVALYVIPLNVWGAILAWIRRFK
jgi:hypothetical protein